MKRAFGFLGVLLAAAVFAGSAFARVGYVHDMTGVATARVGNQAPRTLQVGSLVDQGETISTGENSTAVVKFEDGQIMALQESSAFTVERYFYNKQRVSDSNAAFRLLQGGVRFITGVIGSTNHNAVRLSADTATIGIRGSDGVLLLDPATRIVTAAMRVGAIAMNTPRGSVNIQSNTFASGSPTDPPTTPEPTARATAAVTRVLDRFAAATNIPVNTPVVVAASARAAAAQAQATQLQVQAAANPQDTALQQRAQQATQQASEALTLAIGAAQQAFQQAIQGGAVTPAPPAPPERTPPAPPTTPDPGTTAPGTTTTPTGTSGSGGGGVASPN